MAKDLQLSFTDKEITPWGGLSPMSRLLKKAGFREALQGVGLPLKGSNRGYAPEQLSFDNFTLDMDSTVMSRYGNQEGARRGYNPQKSGRNLHHPLLAFVADCRMVANCWLRSGDADTANNFHGFLSDTLEKLSGKKIGLLRADSGCFSKDIIEHLENSERSIPYIISARLHRTLKRCLPDINIGKHLMTA